MDVSISIDNLEHSNIIYTDENTNNQNIEIMNKSNKQKIQNLTSYNGYIVELFGIQCEDVFWLTGWELAKILNKIQSENEDTKLGFDMTGYLGNVKNSTILGFLTSNQALDIQTKKKNNNRYIIYDDLNSKITSDCKIYYIPSIEINDIPYNSANICRFVKNKLIEITPHVDFAIVSMGILNKYDLKYIYHSLYNLHKKYGILIISTTITTYKGKLSDEFITFVYALSTIFHNIELHWFFWDSLIWFFCYNIDETFINKKYNNMINTYSVDSNAKLTNEYKKITELLNSFIDDIEHTSNIISNNTDEDMICNKWLDENQLLFSVISKIPND